MPQNEKKLSAEIITTGSELVLGLKTDFNSGWLSQRLSSLGIKVSRHTTVGDDAHILIESFKRAFSDSELVVVTGGLGPTEDDLTRQVVAEAFNLSLEFNWELAEQIKAYIKKRGFKMPDNNYRQAWLPYGTEPILNPKGTAPAFCLNKDGRLMVFLPGVPAEMKFLVENWLLPAINVKFPGRLGYIKNVLIKTAGLGESIVDQKLGDLIRESKNPALGLLASLGETRVLVSAVAQNPSEAEKLLAPVLKEIEIRLKDNIFGQDDQSLPDVVGGFLKGANLKLLVMDQVTEGRIGAELEKGVPKENMAGSLSGSLVLREDLCKMFSGENVLVMQLIARNLAEGEASNLFEFAIFDLNKGLDRPLATYEAQVGGPRNMALDRASSLGLFFLWSYLKKEVSEGHRKI